MYFFVARQFLVVCLVHFFSFLFFSWGIDVASTSLNLQDEHVIDSPILLLRESSRLWILLKREENYCAYFRKSRSRDG